MNYTIVNIICNTKINQILDLNRISLECKNTEYEPEVYFALIYRIEKPKLSILVNKSGKIIFTGAKKTDDIEKARELFFENLRRIGYSPQKNIIHYQNIVSVMNLQKNLNLSKIKSERLDDSRLQYEPEIFPGIIFKNINPKFVGLIFSTGKIVLTGIKDEKDIPDRFSIIEQIIEDN